jgi:hypothetical protein
MRRGGDILLGTPDRGKGSASRPAKGRRCAEIGCVTVLSVYNRSATCYAHTPPMLRHALERS